MHVHQIKILNLVHIKVTPSVSTCILVGWLHTWLQQISLPIQAGSAYYIQTGQQEVKYCTLKGNDLTTNQLAILYKEVAGLS